MLLRGLQQLSIVRTHAECASLLSAYKVFSLATGSSLWLRLVAQAQTHTDARKQIQKCHEAWCVRNVDQKVNTIRMAVIAACSRRKVRLNFKVPY
jgi:hypothetical protein